ncbi:MAG: cell division protein FtsZ [Rhizobiales bacterium]|nr:cell division protein FtsZ [Hyphomicrobiales bacterium]
MGIRLSLPNITELKPRICVIGVGGAGGNAINNMIAAGVTGVDFIVANTDAQALAMSSADIVVQLGTNLTEGLGAGARPEIGESAAEEAIDEIRSHISGCHMVFVAAGMGGGTGTGAAPVVARAAHEMGILTVGVVTKPFHFEGNRRMRVAEAGIAELGKQVDTLIVIPNQNLFRIANEKTTFAEAFVMADQVLHSGIACITDLIVREGLINLDFADVRAIMLNMGTAMMGTGEAAGERRALEAAELAIANPLLDEITMKGAKGLLVSITGSTAMTLYEVDEAASRVREEVDPEANIIVGATFDDSLGEKIRVSIVASGLASKSQAVRPPQPEMPRGAVASPHAASAVAAGQTASTPSPQAKPAPTVAQTSATQAQPANPPAAASAPPQPQRPNAPAADRPSSPLAGAPAGAPAGQAPRQAMVVEDDVTIELGPPRSIASTYARPAAGGERQPEPRPESATPTSTTGTQGGAFRPQAPAEIRSAPSRMPDLEAFPAHAQREYRAKSEGQQPEAPVQRKRASLFERLTGRGDGDSEPVESRAPVAPGQPQGSGHSATHNASPNAAPHSSTPNHQREATGRPAAKDTEIPSFFRRQGGGGNS